VITHGGRLVWKGREPGLASGPAAIGSAAQAGQGINEDKREAHAWFLVSLDSGNQSLAADLQQLEAELGSTLTEQAKSEARELEKSVERTVVSRAHGMAGRIERAPQPASAGPAAFLPLTAVQIWGRSNLPH